MKPPFLQTGDTVALLAPGKKVTTDTVAKAQRWIENCGWKVRVAHSVYSTAHSYHSGHNAERLSELQMFLDDPEIKAIICLRGGYGTTPLLDQLKWDGMKAAPKWIVGFSDITALHLQLHRLNTESIHGIMPIQFEEEGQAAAMSHLQRLLAGQENTWQWKTGMNSRAGEATGQLVGGNLSLIADSLATSNELHTFGKILFVEEVDEPLYKIDRMFTQLKRAKKLDKIVGLVAGHFTAVTDAAQFGETLEQIVLSKVNTPIPVAFGCPSGHAAPNFSWIHGAPVRLRVADDTCTITYLD